MGLQITGKGELIRAFPDWFERYQFAGIAPELKRQPNSLPV